MKSLKNLGKINPKFILFSATSALLAGCGGGSGFDFASIPATGDGEGTCMITTTSPTVSSTLKVSSVGTTASTFSVGLGTTKDCAATFKLNGSTITSTTGTSVTILSSSLTAGNNVLVATAGSTTKTWTIYKNSAPTCGTQTPATTGNSMSPGGSLVMTGAASDADSDTLSFAWKVNGATAPTSELNVFNGVGQSQATFNPTVAYLGSNQISMNVSDGIDTTACTWSVGVAGSCSISSTTPSNAGQVRVAFNSATSTNFQAAASSGCLFSWSLNGTPISGATGANYYVGSGDLLIGANILQVTATNGTSTDTKTWTVVKNSPPSCASQTPAATGTTLGVGGSLVLTGNATDLNSDPLTYSWKDNGSAVDPGIFVVVNGSGNSQATFSPNSSYVGTNNVQMNISDGYDTTACSWSVSVVPTCAVASATPSSASLKVAYAAGTANSFVAVPNDASCTISWSLNGSPISGTSAFNSVLSSTFSDAPATNTLVATVSNGFSSATRTWTVTKNQPPTCSSQTPASTGTTIGVGGTVTLTANAGNADGDTLSYSWTRNGSAANPTFFNISSAGNQTAAAFTPNSGFVGSNSIAANISDGYDSASCSWTVGVVNNCAVSSALPSSSTVKVANAGTTSTTFGVVPNDSSCAISWSLNGSPISGTNFISVLSSDLLNAPGTNSLTATLDNGLTAPTTRTWTVTKNRVPTCVSQTPAANPASMPYSSTRDFTANAGDSDGDSLTNFVWRFNGVTSSTLFTPVNTVGNTSVTTFHPTLSQVGPTQSVSVDFDDSYDAGSCSWTFGVDDPNTVQITACTPSTGSTVVVQSAGAQSNQTLNVAATGTALTYSWQKNGTQQPGFTTPSFSLSAGSLPVGDYVYKGVVTDQYANTAFCQWNVRRNAPPTIDSSSPDPATTYKMNVASTLGFAVSSSDLNSGDTLTYTWAIDGTTVTAMLPTGGSSTTFSPALDPAGLDSQNFPKILGAHTISVTVSDGSESVTQSWNVEVNLFSNECNTLANGSVATSGGKICTLVGSPTIGNGAIPSDDQTAMKLQPTYISDDGSGNWFISDNLNNTVSFLNRSGSPITRFGMTIPAGKLVVLIGNGANGVTQDNLYNTAFKLDTPMQVAYDSAGGFLYIADYANHRIAQMDNTGFVTTVFGIANSTTNNAATNTDGAVGTSHVCGNPVGLRIVNWAGNRWLYMTCSSSHSVKKMDALPTSPNYLNGWVVAGRLTSTGATGTGLEDGPVGAARTAQPWALTDDGAGNIYWTEIAGFRVRMAATGGATTSFFTSGLTPGNTFTITATDVGGTYTAGTATTVGTSGTAPITKLVVNAAQAAVTSECIPVTVQAQNASSLPVVAGAAIPITLASTGTGTWWSDFNCSSSIGTSTSIPMGAARTVVYYKNGTNATATITMSSAGLTNGTDTVKVAAAGTPTKLTVMVPSNFLYTNCQMVVVQAQNASSVASPLSSAITVRMTHNATGNFYASSSCTGTPSTTFNFGSGQDTLVVYYAATAVAPANSIITLFGNANTNSVAPTTSGTLAAPNALPIGQVTLRSPRGLAIYRSGATVKGFFVSNYDQHRVLYVNNEATDVNNMGGTKVPALTGGLVLGTGTAGFNTDGIGNVSRVQHAYGLEVDSANSNLLVADYNNYRARSFDFLSANGQITTIVGAGRARSGNLGDSAIGATDMFFTNPSQIILDNANRKMYISDSGNSRVRRLDMLKGLVDTVIGKGSGGATVENEDPKNVFMTSPRGLALVTKSGAPFLLYADQASNASANSNCMIRGWNTSVTTTSIFGTSVQGGRVTTLFGDYTSGCQPYSGPANGTSFVLNNPESIASDGTNLYFTTTQDNSRSDHCIFKSDASGNVNPIVGVCGTAGVTDGSTQTGAAKVRFPTAIVMDPLYSADGNFFFADAIDQNQTRIRYVNFRTSSVTVGSTTVPAATAGYAIVQTIWYLTPSGNSPGWVYGLAAYSNQLCIAGGRPGQGQQGSHNVTCYNRSNPLGPITLRVGPNETSNPPTRGGAPLDRTQEGLISTSALLNGPYGLSFDSSGNLYISERNNHLIRMVRRWNDPSF
ncbi:MAG: hypothetical protein JST04_10980 [Bdellovibrionales bacterium]|nr:hypothetical protein [Bdellovibrionales bacterium]